MKAYLILCYVLWSLMLGMIGCTIPSDKEIYQSSRNEVLKVQDRVKEIIGDEVLIGSIARLNILNDYLLIKDAKSQDTLIHIFNKHTFEYVRGVGIWGEGPDEITSLGKLVVDEKNNIFHAPDLGKNKILAYEMDSVIANPFYKPVLKHRIGKTQFPDEYVYFSDSLSIARIIKILPDAPFQQSLAFWNMQTDEMAPLSYSHPEIERKRVRFNVSKERNIIVEAYSHHDLMTIYDFQGNFKYNVYGPEWDNSMSNRMNYFGAVCFYKDYIMALYAGKENFSNDYLPTSLLVFDMNGNYIRTLDVGYKMMDFCIDEDNNRAIFAFSDEIQFGYLDLEKLIFR